MKPLIEQHHDNVGANAQTAIADSQYGTAENYRDITAMGISTHVRPYARKKRGQLYGKEMFHYDGETDTYERKKRVNPIFLYLFWTISQARWYLHRGRYTINGNATDPYVDIPQNTTVIQSFTPDRMRKFWRP